MPALSRTGCAPCWPVEAHQASSGFSKQLWVENTLGVTPSTVSRCGAASGFDAGDSCDNNDGVGAPRSGISRDIKPRSRSGFATQVLQGGVSSHP